MTTTREDRNAALVMCAILLPALDLVAADRWLEGDGKDLTGLSRAEVTTLTTAVVALTNHRRASAQALREAAERLCVAVDHASVLGGPRLAELREMTQKHEPIDGEERDQRRCVLEAIDAYEALRTALAALEPKP
jgi:hypothetical protein